MSEPFFHVLEGSMRWCGNEEPHYPHDIASYGNALCYFCPGVPGGDVRYRIVGYRHGSPHLPAVLRWIEGDEYVDPPRMYLGERQDPLVHDAVLASVEAIRVARAIRRQEGKGDQR